MANTENAEISEVQKRRAQAVERLLADVDFSNSVEAMPNADLANELLEKVWANTALGTFEHALIGEVIERLRRMPAVGDQTEFV